MKLYKAQIKGKNFLIAENGEEKYFGLLASVYLETNTEEAAFLNAVSVLNKLMVKDGFLKKIINIKDKDHEERPKLFVKNVSELTDSSNNNTHGHYELCSMEMVEEMIPYLGFRYLIPERALSEYVLDIEPISLKENLKEVAKEFISWGYESDSLITLSELDSPVINEACVLFEKGIKEAGFKLPTKQEALKLLVKKYCEWAIVNTLSPMIIAEKIGKHVQEMCHNNNIDIPGLSNFERYYFLYNADYDDFDVSRFDDLDKETINEAKLYLRNIKTEDIDSWIKCSINS